MFAACGGDERPTTADGPVGAQNSERFVRNIEKAMADMKALFV
jgi:hypothetical protein